MVPLRFVQIICMRLSGIVFLLIVCSCVSGQTNTGSVTGKIVDSILQRGLAYSMVSMVKERDSTLVTFTRADSLGNFTLTGIAPGNYLLSISYVGYQPLWKHIQIQKSILLNLGITSLVDLANAHEVTVTARRPPIVMNNDSIEFNTENFKIPPNSVVEDLLKRLPGFVVEKDGSVSFNGQKIPKILVNGKEFFAGDFKMATKNLDADAVDKVQLFDRLSDQAKFTGIEDGQTTKALNLKLKKDRDNSIFGRVSGAVGNQKQYDAQTNINHFKGNKQISFIGMGNNTNKQGFSIGDALNFTGELTRGLRNGGGNIKINNGQDAGGLPIAGNGQNQQGVATTIAGGLNYNNSWNKKMDLNANGVVSDINLLNNSELFRQNILPGNSFNYYSNSSNQSHNKQQKLNIVLDYMLDSFTSFKFTPQFLVQQNQQNAFSQYSSLGKNDVKINEGERFSATKASAVSFSGDLLFRHRLKKKGRTISSSIRLLNNNSNQDGKLQTENQFYAAGILLSSAIVKQINSIHAVTQSFEGNLVYTEPIGKRSLIELNSFYSVQAGESRREAYDFNSISNKFDLLNNSLSNSFTSKYNFMGGGLNLRSNWNKLTVTSGAAYQIASLESINNTLGNHIKQQFSDILPTVLIQYRKSSASTVRFNYNSATMQPTNIQLQPVADISDPLNVYTGNPFLKRSYSHNLALSYFANNLFAQRNFSGFFNYTSINNGFGTEDMVLSNGARKSMPINVNGNFNLLANMNLGFSLKKIKSRIDFGIGFSQFRTNGILNGLQNQIDNKSFTPSVSYQFSMDSIIDLMLSAKVNRTTVSYKLQPQLNNQFYQYSYSLETTNYLPGGFLLNNQFNLIVNRGRADGFNTPIGLWNIYVSKSFLKYKRGEFRLTVLDLLNQNQGINRTATQNFVQDVRYNVLQRYFLIGFSFRLNKAGSGSGLIIKTIN